MQQYSICSKVYSAFNYSVSLGNPFLTKENTLIKKWNMIQTRLSKVSKSENTLNMLHNNCCSPAPLLARRAEGN